MESIKAARAGRLAATFFGGRNRNTAGKEKEEENKKKKKKKNATSSSLPSPAIVRDRRLKKSIQDRIDSNLQRGEEKEISSFINTKDKSKSSKSNIIHSTIQESTKEGPIHAT